jgi:hypothetical protein
MSRPLLVLFFPLVIGTSCTVASLPEVRCADLQPEPCLTATLAIDAAFEREHAIARIGLFGYHGCFGFCPLVVFPQPEPLDALGAVVFSDGSPDAVVTIGGLDRSTVTLEPIQGLTSAQVLAMAGYAR